MSIKVYLFKLGDLDEYNFSDVNFIKIDVEGHEHEVIEGARETIKKFKPTMVIEMEEKHNQIPIEEQISSVEKMGYQCCVFINETIIKIKEIDLDKFHRNPKTKILICLILFFTLVKSILLDHQKLELLTFPCYHQKIIFLIDAAAFSNPGTMSFLY